MVSVRIFPFSSLELDRGANERQPRFIFAKDSNSWAFHGQSQIRLYGSQFELVGDPLVISEDVVLMDAIERKSGESCRVRIPLNIVKMAIDQVLHAA